MVFQFCLFVITNSSAEELEPNVVSTFFAWCLAIIDTMRFTSYLTTDDLDKIIVNAVLDTCFEIFWKCYPGYLSSRGTAIRISGILHNKVQMYTEYLPIFVFTITSLLGWSSLSQLVRTSEVGC